MIMISFEMISTNQQIVINYHDLNLKMPSNDNIGSALAMLGRNLCNVWVLQHLECQCEKSES